MTGVLAEQHFVTGLDVERDDGSVILYFPLAGRDDLALLRLFLGSVRDDDASNLLFRFLDAFDDETVVKWENLDRNER